MGNLRSVQNSFERVGFSASISSDLEVIRSAEKIVLPGVGAFPDGMKNLHELGIIDVLNQKVIEEKTPFLGICLGMQLLAKRGYEHNNIEGLGWIDAEVEKFSFSKKLKTLKVPHVGWDDVKKVKESIILNNIPDNSDFYFVHSYSLFASEYTVGTTNYGGELVAAVEKENIFAVQFHPEKSQEVGMQLIKNFCEVGTVC